MPAGGVGIVRLGISFSGFLVAPFPRVGRSGMTGDPLTIGDCVDRELGAWTVVV